MLELILKCVTFRCVHVEAATCTHQLASFVCLFNAVCAVDKGSLHSTFLALHNLASSSSQFQQFSRSYKVTYNFVLSLQSKCLEVYLLLGDHMISQRRRTSRLRLFQRPCIRAESCTCVQSRVINPRLLIYSSFTSFFECGAES